MHKITVFIQKHFQRKAGATATPTTRDDDGGGDDSGGGGGGGGGGSGGGDTIDIELCAIQAQPKQYDHEQHELREQLEQQEQREQQQEQQHQIEAETIDPLLTRTETYDANNRHSNSNRNSNNNNNINNNNNHNSNSNNNNNNSSNGNHQQQVNGVRHPWQYLYFVTEEHKIHWFWAPAFLALWIILYLWIIIPVYSRLPTPLTIADASNDCTDCFIAERAELHLNALTIPGPRPLGSSTSERRTLLYLKHAFAELQKVMATEVHELEMDVQLGSGNFVQWDQVQAYEGIQNIVLRLRSPGYGNSSTASLLINSHYDTVPNSPGGSDSGIMLAIMLEIVNVLCQTKDALMHPVIFLFNGAGENAQLGAHAFITKHPWAQSVRAAINLDSAGSGGREILFQSGPRNPWLIQAYQRAVKHPFASTMAEELFQRNVIQTSTDLDILYEHGRIPGLDFTYHYNGYVHHTSFDRPEIIPSGTLQNTGDNLLALVREIANASQLQDAKQEANGHMIYFDILGFTLIAYSEIAGIVFNVCAALTTIIACSTSFFMMSRHVEQLRLGKVYQRALFLFILQIFAVLLAGFMCLFVAVLMDFVRLPLVWFTQAWLILGLYYCPLFAGYNIVLGIYFNFKKEDILPIGFRVQLLLHCHCIVLAILTLMLTLSGVRSAFALSLVLVSYTIALVINLITGLHNKPTAWILLHIVMCIFPFLFYAYLTHGFYIALIPMTGWIDPSSNPDLIMISFTLGMGILTGGFIFPIVVLFDKSKAVILTLLGLTCLCFIIALTPLGFPFRPATHVQRFSMVHTTRTFHAANQTVRQMDSGYFILPQDHRSYVTQTCRFKFMCKHLTDALPSSVINGSQIVRVQTSGQGEMLYGLPLYNQYWHQFYSHGFWLSAEAVNDKLPPRPQLTLAGMEMMQERTLLQYELILSGLAQMSIYIRPLQDAKLVAWSFNSSPQRAHWRPPYIVNYAQGTHTKPLHFSLEFKPPSSWNFTQAAYRNETQPIFEIGIAAHWTQHEQFWTNEFQEFVDSFPEYVDVTAWPATYEVWQF